MFELKNGRILDRLVTDQCLILLFRVGLVEARVVGARAGQGDVIIVLDAHCECVS